MPNQCRAPFPAAQWGEPMSQPALNRIGETERIRLIGWDPLHGRNHGCRTRRIQVGIRQPANRLAGFLRR